MKYLITLLVLNFINVSSLEAQDINQKSFLASDVEVINIDMEYGDLNVSFGDVDELQISHNITINGSFNSKMIDIRERKRNGVLNIDYKFDFDEVEERVTLIDKKGNKQILTASEYNKVKNSLKNYNNMNFGYDVDGEISIVIPRNKTVRLSTIYGDMDIVHASPNKKHDLEFHSTYGHIDLSIPQETASNIELQTSYGEIFSDLEFKTPTGGSSKDCGRGENIVTTLNSNPQGTIALEATYDNIYLRKI